MDRYEAWVGLVEEVEYIGYLHKTQYEMFSEGRFQEWVDFRLEEYEKKPPQIMFATGGVKFVGRGPNLPIRLPKNVLKSKSTGMSGIGKKPRIKTPGRAGRLLSHVRKKGSPPKHFKGGSKFRDDQGALARQGGSGKYKKYDIAPKSPKGIKRTSERIIIDQETGQAWYTPDHYKTFIPIK